MNQTYSKLKTTCAQLHHFADASEEGYGTVTYLLLHNHQGLEHTAFIPHMELAATVVASRMDKLWRRELRMELKESVLWSNSN